MVNFSRISKDSILGKILRFPLSFLPRDFVLPVIQGKLKGKKWILGSSVYGCWLGCYEYEKQVVFSQLVKKGLCVYDIGANVGFYTILASFLVGETGRVVAFETLERNIKYLERHIKLNNCKNVELLNIAVGDKDANVLFRQGKSPEVSSVSDNGNLIVKMNKIDTLVNSGLRKPDYIKIDVEGLEYMVLLGAKNVILNYKPTIFLSTYGDEQFYKCLSFLKGAGYVISSIANISDELLAIGKK